LGIISPNDATWKCNFDNDLHDEESDFLHWLKPFYLESVILIMIYMMKKVISYTDWNPFISLVIWLIA
jgi:hypothetical protein